MTLSRYRGKRVLVTGHTGFKGSWLTAWLLKLGAEVIGVSNDIPTQPAMFEVLSLDRHIKDVRADIRDLVTIRDILHSERPDFVFHLAAQPLVARSYADPVETISTNVVGTMNVLEALRTFSWPCTAVLITSDKCYDNVEWPWGYRETDQLGGKDIYSGSKGAAELVIKAYVHSFFQGHAVRLGVARAGNVIGGGDWARDRIVTDCVRAWTAGQHVEIRSPKATRPWQHVLEPLSGYLAFAQALAERSELHGEAFNFGPRAEQNRTVVELLRDLAKVWGKTDSESAYKVVGSIPFHEASLLKLNCDKALLYLHWEPNLAYEEMIRLVGSWYSAFYGGADMYSLTLEQIGEYEQKGSQRDRVWCR
jgi:CDP-glucose 4,6-dehydratase